MPLDDFLKDTIEGRLDDWREYRELKDRLERGEQEALAQFIQNNQDAYARLSALKAQFIDMHKWLNQTVNEMTVETGVREYVQGFIRTQVRKRAGKISEEKLAEWISQDINMHRLPDPKTEPELYQQALRAVAQVAREALVPDFDTAIKVAVKINNPEMTGVEIEEYVTNVSENTFIKMMSTLVIMDEFDQQSAGVCDEIHSEN